MKIYLATWLEEISQKNALDKTGKRETVIVLSHSASLA